MTRLRLRMLAGVLAALWTMSSAGSASAQTVCDRTCLRTLLDQYLAAVVKHDPKAAPLITGFRQTENAINVSPGGGVWKTVTGLGKMQRRYVDEVSGQAGYYGLIEEAGSVALATVRLRTCKTKGCGNRQACETMVFKLMESASKRWRALNKSALLADVSAGVIFVDGEKQENAA